MNIPLTYEHFVDEQESPLHHRFSQEMTIPNLEDIPMTLNDLSQIPKIFRTLMKSGSMNRFESFVKWVEARKNFAPEQIYKALKDLNPFFSENNLSLPGEIAITSMAISPNGKLLAVGAEASPIHVWDLELKKIVVKLGNFFELTSINCLLMTNEYLFSGSWDHKIRKYSILNWEEIPLIFDEHVAPVLSMTITQDECFLISGGEDNHIICWSLQGSQTKKINNAHSSPVSALLTMRSSKNIISASWDKTIKIWSIIDCSLIKTLQGHVDIIRCLAMSQNERILASGGDDKRIRIWSLENYQSTKVFDGHVDCISSMKFSHDCSLLLSASFDKTVKIWDLSLNELKSSQIEHKGQITCLLISPNGKSYITGSLDKVIKLTRLEKDYKRSLLEGSRDEVTTITTFPNNSMAISGGKDRRLRVWNLAKAFLIKELMNHKATITAIAINQSCTKFASADEGGEILIWNAVNFEILCQLDKNFQPAIFLKFNHLNDDLLSVVTKKSVYIRNYDSKTTICSHDRFPSDISAFEIPNVTSFIYTMKETLEIYQIDLMTKEILMTFRGLTKEVFSIRVTRNQKNLLSANIGGTISVWDLITGELLKSFFVNHEIYCFEVLRDNYSIVMSCEDKRIRIWDWELKEQIGVTDTTVIPTKVMSVTTDSNIIIATGGSDHNLYRILTSKTKSKKIIENHKKAITRVEISPNQEILAVASEDTMISLWEMRTWKQLGRLEGHLKPVEGICFTSDSKQLISGGTDNTIRLWNLETRQQVSINRDLGGSVSALQMFCEEKRLMVSCSDCSTSILTFPELKSKSYIVFSAMITFMVLDHYSSKVFMCDENGKLYCYHFKDDLFGQRIFKKSKAHEKRINCIALDVEKNMLISCGDDNLIKIWDISNDTFELIQTLSRHHGKVKYILLNPSMTILISASDDKKIFIWKISNFKKIREFEGHNEGVKCLAITNDENLIISGGQDNSVRVWRRYESRQIKFLEGHPECVKAMALSYDGNILASLDGNNVLILWNLIFNNKIGQFISERGGLFKRIKFTKDDTKLIVSCSYGDDSIKIYDLKLMKEIMSVHHLEVKYDFESTYDNRKLIIACGDSRIRFWNLDTRSFDETVLFEHYGGVTTLKASQNGRTLVSAGFDSIIYVWDLLTYQLKTKMIGAEENIFVLEFNRDESLLFSGGEETRIYIWDFRKFTLVKILYGLSSFCRSIVLSPDNQRLFVGCVSDPEKPESFKKRKNIFVYSLPDYQLLPIFDSSSLPIESMLFSKDGQFLISAGQDKKISFWNYPEMTLNNVYYGFYDETCTLTAQAFSLDNKIIALAGDDYLITVWDLVENRKLALLEGHEDRVNELLITSKKIVISASCDNKIGLWNLDNEKIPYYLQGHTSDVLTIAITSDENELLSSSSDETILMWDLNNKVQIKKFDSGGETILSLFIYPGARLFLSGGSQKVLKCWNMDDCDDPPRNILITQEKIQKISLSPDSKILIVLLSSKKMQIFNTKNFSMMCEFETTNLTHMPQFLSRFENPLVLFYNRLIDCHTGDIIFEYEVPETLLSSFYDIKYQHIVLLTVSFKLYQYDPTAFVDYLQNRLVQDSILTLEQDPEIICNRQSSAFPYFLSFLHLIAIYEKIEYFDKEKIESMYKNSSCSILSRFYALDIFKRTPLDILISKQNTNLIVEYFELLFEYFNKPEASFYEKTRFLLYDFRENFSILNLIDQLFKIIGDDLQLMSDLLNSALIPFDPSIYDNSLVFDELSKPIIIETDSLYINKKIIENKIKDYFKKIDSEESNDEKIEIAKGENKSIVKAKILCLPDICNTNEQLSDDFFTNLSDLEPNHFIFANPVLSLMVNFIWDRQLFYYRVEFVLFFIFFIAFNFNFAFLRYLIIYNNSNGILSQFYINLSIVLDVFLFVYSLFCLLNEIVQFINSKYYFKSIWNYFDISLIPLLVISSLVDILANLFDISGWVSMFKVIFAITMFCFWFRFLSFFRGYKETAYMIRLILIVISGVKYFVFFMVLFMLALATSMYVLHDDNSTDGVPNFWETFLAFYNSSIGNTDDITNYDLVIPNLTDFFMIVSTFLFAIISLNLLVSIIGDKHSEMKENEEKTRIYELINIIVDMNCSLVSRITRYFRPIVFGKYLIWLYNEKHEEKNEDKLLQMEEKIGRSLNALKISSNESMDKQIKVINERFEKTNESIVSLFEAVKEIKEELKLRK